MDSQERRSRPAPNGPAPASRSATTNDINTVAEAPDIERARRILYGLRAWSGRRVDICPCGHDRDESCARHDIGHHGELYRAAVDLQRQAEGRRVA